MQDVRPVGVTGRSGVRVKGQSHNQYNFHVNRSKGKVNMQPGSHNRHTFKHNYTPTHTHTETLWVNRHAEISWRGRNIKTNASMSKARSEPTFSLLVFWPAGCQNHRERSRLCAKIIIWPSTVWSGRCLHISMAISIYISTSTFTFMSQRFMLLAPVGKLCPGD